MKLCNNCLDVTIKNCYLCSIGQEILEECKVTKKSPASRKGKKIKSAEERYSAKDLLYSR